MRNYKVGNELSNYINKDFQFFILTEVNASITNIY